MRLIDADDLHVDYLVPSTTTMTKCYEYVSKAQINNAPTIEAVPVVHGRWTHREDKNGYICNCEQKFFSWNEHPYCQHCGRKMDGGEE